MNWKLLSPDIFTLKNLVTFFAAFSIFFYCSFLLLHSASKSFIFIDEFFFIDRSVFFDYYLAGDFANPKWEDFDSYDVPKFGELFYGAVLRGVYFGKSAQEVLNMGYLKHFSNDAISHSDFLKKIDALCCSLSELDSEVFDALQPVFLGRYASILVFSLPFLLLIFLIGKKIHILFGLLALAVIGTNGLWIEIASLAIGDAMLWFFCVLFLYISLLFASAVQKNISAKVLFKYCSLLGVVFGLATATKLNGFFLFIYFMAAMLLLVYKNLIQPKKAIVSLMLVPLFGYSIFFILNPFLWKSPVQNTVFMAQHRESVILDQQTAVPNAALYSFQDRVVKVAERTIFPNSWYGNFSSNSLFKISGFSADALLLVVGIAFFIAELRSKVPKLRSQKKARLNVELVGLFLCTFLLSTTIFIPLDWGRYYFPYVLAFGFIEAFAIQKILGLLFVNMKSM